MVATKLLQDGSSTMKAVLFLLMLVTATSVAFASEASVRRHRHEPEC